MATMPLIAQNHIDTIFSYFDHTLGPREPTFYYYGGFNDWFRISRAESSDYENNRVSSGSVSSHDDKPILATYRYTDTSLSIIGLAAVVDVEKNDSWEYEDTSIAGREPEYLQLYKPIDDSLVLLAQGCWSNVQPRYRLQILSEHSMDYPYIYEVYFDSAITVTDSFYVAATCFNNDIKFIDYREVYTHPITRIWRVTYNSTYGGPFVYSSYIEKTTGRGASGWEGHRGEFSHPNRGAFVLILPIFDTTGVVLDVQQPTRLAEQYTTLTPNPATTQASLFSSFRIHTVELYDTQGRLVGSRKVEDTQAQLDLTAYPKGLYMVVVTTAAGRTTKKLLIQ